MADKANFSLSGKIILQCGGSGLLGPALASGLVEAGATLVIASRHSQSFADAPARPEGQISVEEVNLEAHESVAALRHRLVQRYGRIDGLVYNAVTRPMRGFADDLSAWEQSMAINATALFSVLRVFGDLMADQRGGAIVNIASTMGMVGSNPWLYEGTDMTAPPDYFFHKAGMINLTRYLASHYGRHGVRVNCVSPGGIYNPSRPQSPTFLERCGKMTMLDRMADANEVAGAVIFLLSDAASYITGTNLCVDGGYTAK